MTLIPEHTIAEVRERTDIVQVIGQHVQLRRTGASYTGLCPFHDEKTPSFTVSPQKQFFHCFGCQESGDVIKFLMKLQGRRFSEVLEELAARAGVEIRRQVLSPAQARAEARRKSERQQGLELNLMVCGLYRDLLAAAEGRPAREYLAQRGIGERVIEAFSLGYAPPSATAVTQLLQQEGVPLDLGERLGLVARRKTREGHHDRFWNRLIFPVIGPGGEVLGFGGRLLAEGDGPKYINTPETSLYRKGEALFGLSVASPAMRKTGEALVVEGNFDVLTMHQWGFDNTVAPMGTALTPRQIRMLRRVVSRVVAVFDGDDAGQAAALRTVPLLVEGDVEGKVATLPGDQDPDSLLREEGAEVMARLLRDAVPAVDFFISRTQEQMEDSIPGRARLLERVTPVIARLSSDVARDLYMGRLALLLGVDPGMVRRAVQGQQRLSPKDLERARRPERSPASGLDPDERTTLKILGLLVDHPHLVPRAENARIASLLTNDDLRATYRAVVNLQQSTGRIDPPELLESIPEGLRNAVAQEIASGEFMTDGDPTRALDDCVSHLQRARIEKELTEVRRQMAMAQEAGDLDTMRMLALRQVELEREIHETR